MKFKRKAMIGTVITRLVHMWKKTDDITFNIRKTLIFFKIIWSRKTIVVPVSS
jgi:hypothetical protein